MVERFRCDSIVIEHPASAGREAGRRRGTKRPKRPWRLALVFLVVLAGLGVLGCGLWCLPEYCSRWLVLERLMDRVVNDRCHTIYGGEYLIRPGLVVGKDRFFERLAMLGYSLDAGLDSPGSYRLGEETISLIPPGDKPGQRYDIHLENGVVQRIVALPGSRFRTYRSLDRLALGRPLLSGFLDSVWEVRRPLSSFPPVLIEAVTTAEDRRFFRHPGLDLKGIVRAALANARKGEITQGGSTITQQLIKTLTGRSKRTYREKGYEAVLSLHLELLYDKQEILTAYLNSIYMGHIGPFALHGMAAAAEYLFGKEVAELEPGECALLAGMIKSPNILSPQENRKKALHRSAAILQAMKRRDRLERGYLYQPPADFRAVGAKRRQQLLAMAWVRQELKRELLELGLATVDNGQRLVLEISVDPIMQAHVAGVLQTGLQGLEERYSPSASLQGAAAIVDQHGGGIRALVGGRDYRQSQFNRATMARRPVGSLIKPFIYLAAMRPETPGGPITPASLVVDRPMRLRLPSGVWRPHNYDRRYLGTISVEEALVKSRNIPAVRIGRRVGLDRVAALVEEVGVSEQPKRFPALFLGACPSNVVRVAAAYSVLAREGEYVAPRLLDRVTMAGSVVYARRPEYVRVFAKQRTRVMTAMLREVLVSGTGRGARRYDLDCQTAGKTGTSNELRDSWFAGYTPDITVSVWVGNDNNKPIAMTGAKAALPLWAKIMEEFGGARRSSFVPPAKNFHPSPANQVRMVSSPPQPEKRRLAPARPDQTAPQHIQRRQWKKKNTPEVMRTALGRRPLKHQRYRFFE